MVHYTHLHLPWGFCILYRFDKRGDGLPMHQHDSTTEHSIICTRGRIAIYGPEQVDYKEMGPGEPYIFDSTQPHEIASLEDYSSVLSVFKNGMPEDYKTLKPSCIDGSMEKKLVYETPNPEGAVEGIQSDLFLWETD